MSPAYDLLNSTIALAKPQEEIALSLNRKKSNLRKDDLIEYFAVQKLQLNRNVIAGVIQELKLALPHWQTLIASSFLSKSMQGKYLELLKSRYQRLEF